MEFLGNASFLFFVAYVFHLIAILWCTELTLLNKETEIIFNSGKCKILNYILNEAILMSYTGCLMEDKNGEETEKSLHIVEGQLCERAIIGTFSF